MADRSVDVRRLTPDALSSPALRQQVTDLFDQLVSGGAALGWVEPPGVAGITELLDDLAAAVDVADACALVAISDGPATPLVGFGYWRRYARATHRPHVDIERVAVDPGWQGHGVGRRLTQELVDAAREGSVEVVTLDFRGDNDAAASLYSSLGFVEYGRLERFVAFGDCRYDKVFYALDLRGRER